MAWKCPKFMPFIAPFSFCSKLFTRFLGLAASVILLNLPLLAQWNSKIRAISILSRLGHLIQLIVPTMWPVYARPRDLSLVAAFLFTCHFVDLNFHEDKRNVCILLTWKRTFWLARDIGCYQTSRLSSGMVRSLLCCVQVPSLCSLLKDSLSHCEISNITCYNSCALCFPLTNPVFLFF